MSAPDFSIVVPTYRRPQPLGRCLEAMARLDAGSPTFELLVVDDGGGLETAAVERGVDALGDRCEILRVSHAGPASARNAGALAARGRWLAFTDDDCEPHPDWLHGFAAGFERAPEAGLGGQTINRLIGNVYASSHQLLVDFVAHRAPGKTIGSRFYPSNNLALPRRRFLDLGGFDCTFPFAAGEDRDLCARWQADGGELAAEPRAVIEHGHAVDFAAYCRMHARYGRGARRFRRLQAQRNGGRVQLEPIGFYLDLLKVPLARPRSGHAMRLCVALLVSQICHAGGYAREWLGERRPRSA